MNTKNVVICGCTKNSSSYIESHLEKLYSIGPYCKTMHIVLFENDSTDATKSKLKHFKESHQNIHLLFDTLNGKQLKPNVTKPYSSFVKKPINLAYARNALLTYVNKNFADFDYMIMVDLDTVVKNLQGSMINTIINKYSSTQWDVLTANSDKKYYDIWALRVNKDIWDTSLHTKLWKEPIDYDCWMMKNASKYVMGNKIDIPSSFPSLIPVNSAFGGLGIYKISALKGCEYSAAFEDSLTCEHVYFHSQIINVNNGKIFICPDLIVKSQCS